MAAKLIKGGEISKQIREEITKEIEELKEKQGVTPGLATILVGDDPGSKVYVGQKEKEEDEREEAIRDREVQGGG